MGDSFVFSKILPINSIVNPNTEKKDYLDSQNPFSFFDFLKNTREELSPLQFNDLYIKYLKLWNEVKLSNKTTSLEIIKERYIQLLREITLKYTNTEEKRFLSNINYEDEFDIDIIIPFYSKKIREICVFYCDKREKLKYKPQKIKIKGTNNSITNNIYETILDVSFGDLLDSSSFQNTINTDDLINNLNIEVEELYDDYTNYFDNSPYQNYNLYDVKNSTRQKYYSSNINEIYANIFVNFDEAVKNEIFNGVRTFLVQFGRIFTINYNIQDVNLNCKPDEKLYNVVSEVGPRAKRNVTFRDRLIRKYMGSDSYYIITGEEVSLTDIVSGVLFKADNPAANLLNRHYPSTASIEEDAELRSKRQIGSFFTPDKNSILYFSVPEKKYKINFNRLSASSTYVFPDPNLYGNTFGLTREYDSNYPITHICEYKKTVKNLSLPFIDGDIDTTPYTQDYFPYFSRNQIADSKVLNKEGLKSNFSSLYDMGIVTKWSNDIFGNQYSLFKPKSKKNLVDNTVLIIPPSSIVCEEYDGGPIMFFNNGLLPEQVFAGHPLWVKPNVWASDYYYNLLIEGGIGGIVNGIMERGMYWGGWLVDGLMIDRSKITNEKFDIILNTLSAKDIPTIDGMTFSLPGSSWEINPVYDSFLYDYDSLIDGNYYSRKPGRFLPRPSKTLDGIPIPNTSEFVPDFTYDYVLSSIKYKDFDAGYLTEYCDSKFNFETQTKFIVEETITISKTITSQRVEDDNINPFELKNSVGQIYVKDVVSGEVTHLSSALAVQFKNKYINVLEEIYKEVIDFNIYNDFMWIRTKSNLIFEKLNYEDDKFIYSGTDSNFIKFDDRHTNNVSNPFIFENREYAMVGGLSAINTDSNNFSIIPLIYKINYNKATISRIYVDPTQELYKNNIDLNPIKITRINKPVLTYNTRNNKYCLMATIEDQNEFPYIYQYKFNYNGSIMINQEVKLFTCAGNEVFKTYNFKDISNFTDNLITFNDLSMNSSANFIQSEGVLNFN